VNVQQSGQPVIRTCGGDAGAFRLLADAFTSAELAPSAHFDDWAVLAVGIGEILTAHRAHSDDWDALRERYYEKLRENKKALD